MKLNQATAAALLFAATLTSSSSAASVSSHDELNDKIAPLLASNKPNRHLRRMLQSSDQCIADLFDTESFPTFDNALTECASVTVVGNTITIDDNACDLSLLTEACAADSRTIVAGKWGDIGLDCTLPGQSSSVKFIVKASPWCIAPSCVSEWESGDNQMSDETVKAFESFMSQAGGECKVESSSAGASGIKAMKIAAIVIGMMLGNFLVFSWRKKKMKKEEEKKKVEAANKQTNKLTIKMVKYVESREEWDGLMEKSKTQLVVVDFFASWCPPCKFIAPIFEQLSEENPNVIFVKVDVDAQESIKQMCGISAMPTFQFFKNGQKVAELCGAHEEGLRRLIAEYA